MIESKVSIKNDDYPCIKIYKDESFIVLFTAPNTGIVIYSNTIDWSVGNYISAWREYEFTPYNNTIILKNK